MFKFIKNILIRFSTYLVNAFDHTKCASLIEFEPALISLHPNEYTKGLRYYQFAVNLDRCVGSCNTPS